MEQVEEIGVMHWWGRPSTFMDGRFFHSVSGKIFGRVRGRVDGDYFLLEFHNSGKPFPLVIISVKSMSEEYFFFDTEAQMKRRSRKGKLIV